jgi:hypothetical protein
MIDLLELDSEKVDALLYLAQFCMAEGRLFWEAAKEYANRLITVSSAGAEVQTAKAILRQIRADIVSGTGGGIGTVSGAERRRGQHGTEIFSDDVDREGIRTSTMIDQSLQLADSLSQEGDLSMSADSNDSRLAGRIEDDDDD